MDIWSEKDNTEGFDDGRRGYEPNNVHTSGEGKERILPKASTKDCSPANILISAWNSHQTSEPTEIGKNILVLTLATESAVIGYSSNRKLNSRDDQDGMAQLVVEHRPMSQEVTV